jgi:LmbE family N-acetylglucosaminyl deacetylase
VQVVEFLGFHDSGMTGWEQNTDPRAFCNASVDDAVARLAAIAGREGADVLLSYDWHGGYGHPDHIMVHRVGRAAVEGPLSGTRLLEGTMNRDRIRAAVDAVRASGASSMSDDADSFDPDAPADDGNPMGTPEAEIALEVHVADHVADKRAAIACHASQIGDSELFLAMPDEMFTAMFGTEWYIDPDRGGPPTRGWIL